MSDEIKGSCLRLCKPVADEIERLQAEIERLKNAYKQCVWERDVFSEDINAVKSEAIKEFADRLKNCFCISAEYVYIMNIIDNLVKEMTEPVKLEHNSLCETETYLKG